MTRITVQALIDWKSQAHNAERLTGVNEKNTKYVLEKTAKAIAMCLRAENASARFSVSLRLYHGWMKGWEIQPSRKILTSVIAGLDFASLSPASNVIFQPTLTYGDLLLDACDHRLNGARGIHLGNTLRQKPHTDKLGEKMVDTALAADLLSLARSARGEWLLVVAEDDDHVPPVFVAERWLEASTSRVLLMRKRASKSQYLNLDGLLVGGNWK